MATRTHDFPLIKGAAAVGRGQCGRTLLQVPRLVTVLGGAAYGDGVDAVGVAVAGAVVPLSPAVPRRPDENGAQALPTLEGKKESEESVPSARTSRVGSHAGPESFLRDVPPKGLKRMRSDHTDATWFRGLSCHFHRALLPVTTALQQQNHRIALRRRPRKPSLLFRGRSRALV